MEAQFAMKLADRTDEGVDLHKTHLTHGSGNQHEWTSPSAGHQIGAEEHGLRCPEGLQTSEIPTVQKL